ncbi:MAG: bifunctional histidinol-phosphatase/imidazoleglycerol-phosphate dehydratase HisB [Acidobacteria bacterium]|nr:bifunctional histidinol-phosphatase/imidazoleglycerol-phosphate dehydratase HisB [Acidobacteriota bacterium]
MKRVLFIDRDGTIIREPEDFQVDVLDKLRFIPGAITYLSKIARETDFILVLVTNQDGMGTESFPESAFWPAQNFMLETLAGEGIEFADVYVDRTFPHENAPTRKPGTAMLKKYIEGDYDLAYSFVIGDRPTDVELAKNLGSKAIYIKNENFPLPEELGGNAETVVTWKQIYDLLRSRPRRVSKSRKTKETDITVTLDLDGSGRADMNTGIAFFDHMLEQIAKHGSVDLDIRASGDLQVDEHHTIEDVAITLGEAFAEALGDKRGIERYGFCLPMDDCLAQVAVDFGGRSWTEWDAEFKRERIGEMPTEMFFHFFKSFADGARCNLNIKAEGTIEHHKIESIFKAFARAIKMAVRREGSELPSTKGVL